MKLELLRKFLPLNSITLALGLLATTASSQAAFVDWENGIWDHGSGPVVGYQSGQTTGVSDIGGGVIATVSLTRFGTAAGIPGEDLTVSTVLSGMFAAKSLRIQQQSDSSATASMDNYASLKITFSSPVSFPQFTIFDVDTADNVTGWDDHVKVSAETSGVFNTVGFALGATNQLSVGYPSAIPNIGSVEGNAPSVNGSGTGNVGVTINGTFTSLSILYASSTGLAGRPHGISISPLIPEPSSAALAALGMGLLLRRSRRKLA